MSRLYRDQVERILETARQSGQKPDLYAFDLRQIDLSGIDLSGADLSRANLAEANLSQATLAQAGLFEAILDEANLSRANLHGAILHGANLKKTDLSQANLSGANLFEANLDRANLAQADLTRADLTGTYLNWANLSQATLKQAHLAAAHMRGTNLSGANLDRADLSKATLIGVNLAEANLNDSCICGISAKGVTLTASQHLNLIISSPDEPIVAVDDFEVARFVYLLLQNPQLGEVVDLWGKKLVLIAGSFGGERSTLLVGMRSRLRARGYLPISFNAERPGGQGYSQILSTLVRLSRFVIVDLSEARSVTRELDQIVPNLPWVPVQPLLSRLVRAYAMLLNYRDCAWILDMHSYHGLEDLLTRFEEKVLQPAESKAAEIAARRLAAISVAARRGPS